MSLMQTGSSHESMKLDDPGFVTLQFQSLNSSKKATYATYGLGLEGTLIELNNDGFDVFYDTTESTQVRLINAIKNRVTGNKVPCRRRVDKSFDMQLNRFLDKEKAANAVTMQKAA